MLMPLLPAFMAGVAVPPDFVLINIGAVDVADIRSAAINEATWEMDDMLDAVHAQWPLAQIRVMKVYRFTYEPEAATLATWIDNLLVSRSAWASVGPDERTFLIPHTSDGIHPTATGYSITALLWQQNMGY